MKFALSLVAALLLAGCASQGGVSTAPPEAGIERHFSAAYEKAKDAALRSVQNAGLRVVDAYDAGAVYQIDFSKSPNLTSWGEFGRVLVVNEPPGVSIHVHSEKASKYQISGSNTGDFAFLIFTGIEQELAATE